MTKIDEFWVEWKRVIKDNGAIVMTASQPFTSKLVMSNLKMFKYEWVWEKNTKSNFPQAGFQPLNNIEYVLVFSDGYARNFPENSNCKNKQMKYNPQFIDKDAYKIPKESKTTEIFKLNHKNGTYKHKQRDTSKRYPTRLLKFNVDKNKLHPTQKPVPLMEYLIKTYTNEGDTVFDGFAGSFTTAIACDNLKRQWICCETDKQYCEIGLKRINENRKKLNSDLLCRFNLKIL